MLPTKVLTSVEDASANFVFEVGNSYAEARFVQRTEEYFIIYVSSHNGCNQACRFCHLTQTKQTEFEAASAELYCAQVDAVLGWAVENKKKAKAAVHVNFMARGEPLLNDVLTKDLSLFDMLSERIGKVYPNLEIKFKVSTIMPKSMSGNPGWSGLCSKAYSVEVYFSVYSAKEAFAKRWVPNRMELREAFNRLYDLSLKGVGVRLHWALIEGENDTREDFDAVLEVAREAGFEGPELHFNLVRYNPPVVGGPDRVREVGREPGEDVAEVYVRHAATRMATARSIARVGFDVKASCGMFVSDRDIRVD